MTTSLEAILGAVEAEICEILDANFGEYPFHALGWIEDTF